MNRVITTLMMMMMMMNFAILWFCQYVKDALDC